MIVESQSDFRRRRDALAFCYLCGKPLAGRDVMREHLIPSSLLRHLVHKSPAILNAHRDCEATGKKPYDEQLFRARDLHLAEEDLHARLQSLMARVFKEIAEKRRHSEATAKAAADLAASAAHPDVRQVAQGVIRYVEVMAGAGYVTSRTLAEVRSFVGQGTLPVDAMIASHIHRRHFDPITMKVDGQAQSGLLGFEDALRAVWNWVRGMHSLLYSSHLPDSATAKTFCDVQYFTGDRPVGSPEVHKALKEFLLERDDVDRVVIASGHCEYRCAWVRLQTGAWRCAWYLTTGGPKPFHEWSGGYERSEYPAGAAVLSDGSA